ncbi:MAG: LUD domain-containing protein [Candidatus Heimdallarchaeota archaeon]
MGNLPLYLESRDVVSEVLANKETNYARKQSIMTVDKSRAQGLAQWSKEKLEKKRALARAAKEEVISNLGFYVDKAMRALEAFACDVYLVKTLKEAQKIVEEIVGEGKLIVKSKSTVGKEMKLTEILETKGNRVVETDLGDRLVQLDGNPPSHALAPALHLPLKRIAELLRVETGIVVDPAPKAIVEAARGKIRDMVIQADLGITGANFIAAEEGIVGICTNEGNARLVSSLPEEHLVVTGINKLIPSLEQAPAIIELIGLFGLGMPSTCYTSLISGPSRTGDIQMQVVLGMHGPKKVHVLLLDNKRSDAIGTPLEEALFCLNCGACADVCPAYMAIGSRFGDLLFGAIGPIWASIQHSIEKAVQAGLYFCTLCGKCAEFCPVKIDLPKILIYLRGQALRENLVPPPLEERSERVKTTGNVFGGL